MTKRDKPRLDPYRLVSLTHSFARMHATIPTKRWISNQSVSFLVSTVIQYMSMTAKQFPLTVRLLRIAIIYCKFCN